MLNEQSSYNLNNLDPNLSTSMNDGLNKSHSTTEESNKNPNTVEDLSINGPTLIKIQAGKVINYIEGESEIRAILE